MGKAARYGGGSSGPTQQLRPEWSACPAAVVAVATAVCATTAAAGQPEGMCARGTVAKDKDQPGGQWRGEEPPFLRG